MLKLGSVWAALQGQRECNYQIQPKKAPLVQSWLLKEQTEAVMQEGIKEAAAGQQQESPGQWRFFSKTSSRLGVKGDGMKRDWNNETKWQKGLAGTKGNKRIKTKGK